jgi:hypothetical protein
LTDARYSRSDGLRDRGLTSLSDRGLTSMSELGLTSLSDLGLNVGCGHYLFPDTPTTGIPLSGPNVSLKKIPGKFYSLKSEDIIKLYNFLFLATQSNIVTSEVHKSRRVHRKAQEINRQLPT